MDIFCQIKGKLGNQIIEETENFYLMHDGYPLSEAHLLIIPREHIRCFLELPDKYKNEFESLKKDAITFVCTYYQQPVVFEHGVVAQTVPHAHLHLLPTEKTILPQIKKIAEKVATPKVPYLYYEKKSRMEYYSPTVKIEAGFLHLCFAKKLKCPLNGPERTKELEDWLLRVKKRFQEWQKKV